MFREFIVGEEYQQWRKIVCEDTNDGMENYPLLTNFPLPPPKGDEGGESLQYTSILAVLGNLNCFSINGKGTNYCPLFLFIYVL